MVQQLFSDLQKLKTEIRRLRGDLNRIAAGGTLLISGGGGGTIPDPLNGAMIRGNSSPGWERLALSAPSSGLRNVVGADFGDTQPSYKALLDTTNPSTLDYDDTPAPGTSLIAARRDHVHGMPSAGGSGAVPIISELVFVDMAVPTQAINSTSYIAIGLQFLWAAPESWTHYRIVFEAARNSEASPVTTTYQLTPNGSPASPISSGGDDLVLNSNVNANWDSGWKAVNTSLVEGNYYRLAGKGSNGTVDLIWRSAKVYFKYDP